MHADWINNITKVQSEYRGERSRPWDFRIRKDGKCIDLIRDEMQVVSTAERSKLPQRFRRLMTQISVQQWFGFFFVWGGGGNQHNIFPKDCAG